MKKVILLIIVLYSLFTINSIFAQTLTQTVKGRVFDKDSYMPLPGATVVVLESNPFIGDMSDADGYFRLEAVPVGRHTIKISFIGYQHALIHELLVGTGKEVVLEIGLKESFVNLDEVVVRPDVDKSKAINQMATVSARTFNVEETQRYAGGFDDPARLASSFAGVTTSGGAENNGIIVRGNAPTGVHWRVEGVEVTSPNHFDGSTLLGGGFVTYFSNYLLSNSDFLTGAFPAEYGNALSAVFDINLRKGNYEKHEHSFQAGVMGIDLASEGPFVKDKNASYIFNYRYSTFGLLRDFLPEGEGLPVYQDFCFKVNLQTKKAGTFSVWGVGALDDFRSLPEMDSTKWDMRDKREDIDVKTKSGILGLTNKLLLGNKTYINTSLAGSGSQKDIIAKWLNDSLVLDYMGTNNSIQSRITIHSFINYKFNVRHTNRTGFEISNFGFNFDRKHTDEIGSPLLSVSNYNGNSYFIRLYTQSRYTVTDKIILNAGLHSQYFILSESLSFEPRIGAKWNFSPRQALGFAYGKHSRMQLLNMYFIKMETIQGFTEPNRKMDFTKAHHFVLAYDISFSEKLRLKIEPYYQYLYSIPVIADSSFALVNLVEDYEFREVLINKGTGRNIGVDITFERFLHNGLFYMLTASVFNSKYTGGDGIERSTRFNKNYVVNMLAGKEWMIGKQKNNILGVSGRLYLYGGDRISPIDYEASVTAKEVVYDENLAFEKQLPTTSRFDISLTYRINKPKYNTVWSFQLMNALGSVITYSQDYNYVTDQVIERKGTGGLPSFSWKIEF